MRNEQVVPLFVSSPLNKPKHEIFSQTGTFTGAAVNDPSMEDSQKLGNSIKSQTMHFQTQLGLDFLNLFAKD